MIHKVSSWHRPARGPLATSCSAAAHSVTAGERLASLQMHLRSPPAAPSVPYDGFISAARGHVVLACACRGRPAAWQASLHNPCTEHSAANNLKKAKMVENMNSSERAVCRLLPHFRLTVPCFYARTSSSWLSLYNKSLTSRLAGEPR